MEEQKRTKRREETSRAEKGKKIEKKGIEQEKTLRAL